MSLNAYQKTQKAAESPRQTEYRLFAQVTRALIEAKDLRKTDIQLHKALDWNRQLWSVLASDCQMPDNPLPKELRAGIVSLSIFVSKHASKVARGEESMDTLIEINRTIMEGLAMQAGATAAPAQAAAGASADAPPPAMPTKPISV